MSKYIPKKEVIDLLNSGHKITTYKNESFGIKGQLVYKSRTYYMGEDLKKVHNSTILSLQREKIIDSQFNKVNQ